MRAGWSFLAISARWRCGPGSTADKLPNDSRGALSKATAHTILPHAVKG